MRVLLDPAVASTVRVVRPPGKKLDALTSYKQHATYLGQLNMALGYYRLIGGDDRYEGIHRRISDVLHKALVELKGRPLASFPAYSWSFDTIPCLVSLKLYDRHTGKSRSNEVIRKHLEWLGAHAVHKPTGLPYSRINNTTGRGIVAPRGCDLSWRISLIAHLDAARAKAMYNAYVKAFWLDRTMIRGFAEWPGGKLTKQDADSGPILLGIGMTASGMGIAASQAAGDTPRTAQLARQTADFKKLMQKIIAVQPAAKAKLTMRGQIDPASNYVTGFLYGDACLFYAATWRAWPAAKNRPATRPADRGPPVLRTSP